MKQLSCPKDNLSGKVVIFDFGGVISKTLFETHDLTERALGLSAGTLNWMGPFDPENDPLWRKMQQQKITERDYWLTKTKEVAILAGKDWSTMQQFVVAARGAEPAAVIRDEALQVFQILKQANCRLAILSNELDLFYGAEFRATLPFLVDFEVIVDATYTKILKPDSRAYQLCFDELEVNVQDCIFVDDQAKNIQGAADIGLASVHFDVCAPHTSYQELLNKVCLL